MLLTKVCGAYKVQPYNITPALSPEGLAPKGSGLRPPPASGTFYAERRKHYALANIYNRYQRTLDMAEYWKIGTTTVRNPKRLPQGLVVLADHLANRVWNDETQAQYYDLLTEAGMFSPKTTASAKEKAKVTRTWVSPLSQFGFIHLAKYEKIRVLPPGKLGIDHEPSRLRPLGAPIP